MKKLLYSIFLLSGILGAVSCSQELEGYTYKPNSDDAKEIHFNVSSLKKTFGEDEKAGIVELTLVRPGNVGTFSVELSQMGADTTVFSFDKYATIEDGEYSSVIPILVDLKNCVKGMTYATSLYIVGRDQNTGNYGVQNAQYSDAVDLEVNIELEWEPMMITLNDGTEVQQTATYTYNAYWSGTDEDLLVEKAIVDDNSPQQFYRLTNWGANDVSFMWVVNSDNTTEVPKQTTGTFNSNYNQYINVSDYPHNPNHDYTYKSYPCTFDGDRTYSFTLIYYRDGSTGNFGYGVETLVMDNMEPETPAVEIAYNGIDSTATGFIGAKLAFTPNETTHHYIAAVFNGELSEDALAEAIDSLKKGNTEIDGAAHVLTLYKKDEQSWNLTYGPVTVAVAAFDVDGNLGETSSKIFTFDPENEYGVNVIEAAFYNDPSNENYDATKTLFFKLKTKNFVKGWYTCRKTSGWTSLLKSKTYEEIITGSSSFSSTAIASANGNGYSSRYTTLDANTEYTIGYILENKYGERVMGLITAKTASTSSNSDIDEFKSDVTIDSFVGSYLMDVEVGANKSSTTDYTIRVDINKMDDNRVVISGLGGPIAGFDPMVVAYFDGPRHCLIIDPQNIGTFNGNYIHFAGYTGSSYNYGSCAYMLGWVDDEIVWVSSPDYSTSLMGYTFMEFSSPLASSSTYLKTIVDSKVFVNPTMQTLERAIGDN
ncbi:MAG: hypothetical protein K5984_07370 [Bacteroidales bacterium]|nr:hypothetical protein [Bacteroidales bacterium]